MKKSIFIFALSLIYVGAIYYIVDVERLISVLGKVSSGGLVKAGVLVIIANFLALVRSGAVLKTVHFWPGWRSLFLAFSASNIANLPLNVVGQSLTRAVILARAGIPFGVTVMSTYLERFLAATLLFVFSLAGLWYLLGDIDVDFRGGAGAVLTTFGGVAVVSIVVSLTVFRRRLLRSGGVYLRWLPKLWISAGLTVFIHAAGVAAYLVVLIELAPHSISFSLVSALLIVMLITVLPISFAGWGLRELSAATALGFVGIAPEIAVATALSVGLLYLVATGLFGVLGLPLIVGQKAGGSRPNASIKQVAAESPRSSPVHDWDVRTIQGCALLTAVLLFFRLPTVFGSSQAPINVNLADIVVFVGLGVILLMIAAGRIRHIFPPFLTISLVGISSLLILGLLISFARHNLGSWALYTRGVGWILMLGYTALGAAMVSIAGEKGRLTVLRTLTVTAMTICVLLLLELTWSAFVFHLPLYVLPYPFQGFAGNQNAFSFELATVGVLLIVTRALGIFTREWVFTTAIIITIITIFLTGSRTGAVFIAILALLDLLWTRKTGNHWRNVTLFAALAVAFIILTPYVARLLSVVFHSAFGINIDVEGFFSSFAQADLQLHSYSPAPDRTRIFDPSSDSERWRTIVAGLSLWRNSPLFGAGLGAYVEAALASGQHLHGIHSVYVWFLAEMGLVGLAVILCLGTLSIAKGWQMAFTIRRGQTSGSSPWGLATLGLLLIMAIGGLVQDFFFQRIFWFLIGMAAFDTVAVKGAPDARWFLAAVAALGLTVFALAL